MLKQFESSIPLKGLYVISVVFYILIDSRFSLPFQNLLRWVFPAILLLAAALHNGGKFKLSPNGFYVIMVLYFGFTITYSPVQKYSLERWISLLLVVGMYSTYYCLLSDNNLMDDVLKILGCLYILYGIANIICIRSYDGGRLVGFTNSSNSLGLENNISLVFATYFYEEAEHRHKKFWIAFMIPLVIEIALSGSRSAFVSMCLWIVYFFVFVLNKRGGIAGIIIPLLALFLPKNLLMNIPGLNRLVSLGANRNELWDYALAIYRQKPWLGWGYGAANTTTSIYVAEGLGYHSSYLTVLIETGRIGLCLLLILCFMTGFKGIQYWLSTRSFEMRTMLLIFIEMLLCFYGESAMTSVGSTEGFIFWGILVWILLKSREPYNFASYYTDGEYDGIKE